MNKTSLFQSIINITKDFETKNSETIINCVDEMQRQLIRIWQSGDNKGLKKMLLINRHIFNFWLDSIKQNEMWEAVIRCGALIGTLEMIEKIIYEENMDLWIQKRIDKNNLSNKFFKEIILFLDSNGTMTLDEIAKEFDLDKSYILEEFIKMATDLGLIHVNEFGKYQMYYLSDVGIRYAKIPYRKQFNEK